MHKPLRWVGKWVGSQRSRYGWAAIVVILYVLVTQVIDSIQRAQAVYGARHGIGRVLLSPWLRWPLFVLAALALVGLHFYDLRHRASLAQLGGDTGIPTVVRMPAETTPAVRPHEPHDPGKEYTGTPRHEISGQGRYRILKATLHDIGNGFDRGVRGVITPPVGRRSAAEWNGLDTPEMRRRVAGDGVSVSAAHEGLYVISWQNLPLGDYEPEVIAREEVGLGPTGPLPGWVARHEDEGMRTRA